MIQTGIVPSIIRKLPFLHSFSPRGLFFCADLGEPEGVSPRIRQRDAIDPWADPLRLAWMAIWLRIETVDFRT